MQLVDYFTVLYDRLEISSPQDKILDLCLCGAGTVILLDKAEKLDFRQVVSTQFLPI